jgi:fluoroacetyl-CoA thioesterase
VEFSIKPGLLYSAEKTVQTEDTAAHYGSGLVAVFATPAMIALMENTAMHVVLPYLPEGYNTVGTEINVKHIKATPVGIRVTCEARLLEVDGKKLVFSLVANDEEGKIGEGTHTRYIINTAEFMKRIEKNKL